MVSEAQHGAFPIPGRKADPNQVIKRYQQLHNLERTGREFGITRERVRQIVNRAGISTARILKPKPAKPERFCKECGEKVNSSHALYCETHRREKHKRRYRAIKADPVKYAHWRELLKKYDRKRRERQAQEKAQNSLTA
ncbi:MAG: sigma factor-like helix-turn-helix DNA-binding protein [Chloroflexota bacterium]